jgi:multidrug efflux pump subunit AcrA (membrane-fusion protein)
MLVRIKVGGTAEQVGWSAVKLFGLVVVIGALVSSTSRGVMKPTTGLKTVLPAVIRAGQVDTLTVPFGGRVKQVLVAPGDEVAAGQLLLVLESEELSRQIERARRHLVLAQARVGGDTPVRSKADDLQLRGAERSLELARRRLARYSIADAESAYSQARKRKEQLAALVASKMATAGELALGEREEENELRNLKAAQETYSRLEQEVESYENQIAILNSYAAATPASAATDSEIADASAVLEDLLSHQANLEVKAPRNGVVLSGIATAGDRVFAGAPIAQVADISRLCFEAPVSATIARQVRPGTPVRIRVPTEPPQQIDAEVSSVALVPDPVQQSYVVRAVIANPERGVILVGMEGAMEFPHSESTWRRLF